MCLPRPIIVILLVTLLLAGLVTAQSGVAMAGERVLLDRVLIVVDDLVLTQREVASLLRLQARELAQRYEGAQLEEQLELLERNLIDRLVDDLLLEARAQRLGIEIDDEQIEDRLDSIIAREPTVLEAYGESEIKAFIVKDLLKQSVLQREVNAFLHVREDEVLERCQLMEQNSRQVQVAHILIRGTDEEALARIMEIQQQLGAGADFLETAAALSEDPSAAQNSGDLGFMASGQFVKPFEEAAFALEVGTISSPVQTQFGYHLIKVLAERSDAGIDCTQLDTAARERFSDEVYNVERAARMEEYLARLREQAQIRIMDTP